MFLRFLLEDYEHFRIPDDVVVVGMENGANFQRIRGRKYLFGDLNKRRGQVEGMESSRSGARIVKAKVPLAEMFGYVTALRTITSGRATSSMTYDHHAQVSSSIAKAVLEEVKGRVDLV